MIAQTAGQWLRTGDEVFSAMLAAVDAAQSGEPFFGGRLLRSKNVVER